MLELKSGHDNAVPAVNCEPSSLMIAIKLQMEEHSSYKTAKDEAQKLPKAVPRSRFGPTKNKRGRLSLGVLCGADAQPRPQDTLT